MAEILRLPDHGALLVATDLQGNVRDFARMADLFRASLLKTGGDSHLLFTGDLVHGPHLSREDWPGYLGAYYKDESGAVVDGFLSLRAEYPDHVHCILGNHEHAHIGGPHTAKFAVDDVALLESSLGPIGAERLRNAFRSLALVAVAPCGIVFTHGAPAAEIHSAAQIEATSLDGLHLASPVDILTLPILGAILWARSAASDVARRFLAVMGGHISVYGHDVIPEGYERIGDEQLIVSTSFGVEDSRKVYVELDLGHLYRSVHELREGHELLRLYP